MSILSKRDDRVGHVTFTQTRMTVQLVDGRGITVPLEWYPRLSNATVMQRTTWQPTASGHGIHWPAIDEDLSVVGLLRGTPAPGGRKRQSVS